MLKWLMTMNTARNRNTTPQTSRRTGCGAGGGEERATDEAAGFFAGVLLFFAAEAGFFLLVDLLDAIYVVPTS